MIRLNAVYQVFHGTEGLRKHKVFLASVVEFSVCVAMATWTEKREIEPLAGIPGPGCVISEYPNTVLTLPAWYGFFTLFRISCFTVAIFLAGTLRLLYSSTKSRFKCFADFTLSNIREEIRNIQPITRVLVKDNASRLIIHIRGSFVRSSQGGPSREIESVNFASRSLVVSHAGTHA
ncbi:hypothetical protein EDC04DRAFT_2768994 [Pisolithus marmoratus]|nr:hypothetical protein EDC04DRAFT_2768994 [Pisolithus marmoratus]